MKAHFSTVNRRLINRCHNWFKYSIILHESTDSTTISRQRLGYYIEPFHSRYYWIRCRSFFIETILEKNRNKRKKLLDHYEKINVDVIDRWINHSVKLHKKIANAPESPIPLYVQISDDLKSMYFNRLRSHLKTAYKKSGNTTLPYREADDIITDIEQNENKHNQRVANFINEIKQKIRDAIHTPEDCNIKNIIEHVHASSITPTFVMDHIINYYIAKSAGIGDILEIRKLNSEYQLFRTSDMLEEMGRGDEETVKCLKMKLDTLEKDVVKTLKELRDEANRLNEKFNSHLKSKATDLKVQIGDGYFHGKCEFESKLKLF